MRGYFALVTRRNSETPAHSYKVEFPELDGCRFTATSVEDGLARAGRALDRYAAERERQGLTMPPTRASWLLAAEADRFDALAAACITPSDDARTPERPSGTKAEVITLARRVAMPRRARRHSGAA